MFHDLSEAMKSSSSRLELSSLCPSFSFVARLPKKLTRKFGISASEFVLHLGVRTFPFNVFEGFLQETFWRSNKPLSLADCTMKYGPLNRPIIALVPTERYNDVQLSSLDVDN